MISKHTILYAEDDPDDLFMVKQAFEQHDHIEVIHAPNGLDALQLLESMKSKSILPCLVILDINMPVMDGKEALRKIRETTNFKEIPVVLFSTSNSNSDKTFAEQWQAELVTKPLSYGDLESIARSFVDKCNFEINRLTSNN
jgi:CheY-like chemotaxis protein